MYSFLTTVELRLANTPEIQTSTVVWTLSAVPNVFNVYKTTVEIRTPLYSEHTKRVPTVSALEGFHCSIYMYLYYYPRHFHLSMENTTFHPGTAVERLSSLPTTLQQECQLCLACAKFQHMHTYQVLQS